MRQQAQEAEDQLVSAARAVIEYEKDGAGLHLHMFCEGLRRALEHYDATADLRTAERAVLAQILPAKNAASATSHSVKTSVTYSGSDAESQKNLEKAAADYRAAMAKEEEE